MDNSILLFVLLLAAFLGLELIRRVPGNLHTPLMSGSNAISGIAVVGAMAAAAAAARTGSPFALGLAGFGVGFAAINVVGGYVVTDRMLKMFGGAKPKPGGAGTPGTGAGP